MRRLARFRTAALVLAAALMISTELLALPTMVFVYNRNVGARSNGYDNNALAFILQELGLLDADGKPNIPEAQTIRDAGGNVIGYRSADGTKEAYDVNSGFTTDDAWQRVAMNGMLHIIKHGNQYRDPSTGTLHDGGGMTLDRGQVYDGFKEKGTAGTGTGAGHTGPGGVPSGAYPLTPRPGANITLNLNGCWTSKDPDGAGPVGPVTGTGGGVPGVGTTMGEPNQVGTQVGWVLVGGTQQERDAALERLRQAARAAGYPPEPTDGSERGPTTLEDIDRFISDLPVDTRYDKVQEIVDSGKPPAVKIRLRYRKVSGASGGGGFTGTSHCPMQIPLTGGGYAFDYINGDPDELLAASLQVAPGSQAWPGIFLVSMKAELPAPPPSGMGLASAAFHFETTNGDPVAAPIEMAFGVFGPANQVEILWYDSQLAQWRAPIGTVARNGQVVTITSARTGIYAAFSPSASIPTLSQWGLLALLTLSMAAATVMLRRQSWRGPSQMS